VSIYAETTEANTEELTPIVVEVSESSTSELSPDELFEAYVYRVRDNGDPIDTLGRTLFPMSNLGGRAGLTLAAAQLSTEAVKYSGNPAVPIIVGFIALGFKSSQMIFDSHKHKPDSELLEKSRKALNIKYELYKDRDISEDLTLRWYGVAEDDSDSTSAHLQRIALLAYKNDIPAIQIEASLVEAMAGGPVVQPEVTRTNEHDFLKIHKGIEVNTKKAADRKLYTFTPKQLSEFIEQISEHAVRSETEDTTLTALVDDIRGMSPNHPIVASYDRNKAHPDQLIPALKRSSRALIESKLHEPVRSHGVDPTHRYPVAEVRRPFPMLRGETAHFSDPKGSFGSESLARAIGVSRDELMAYETDPARLKPKVRLQIAEYRIYLATIDRLEPSKIQVGEDVERVDIVKNEIGLQADITSQVGTPFSFLHDKNIESYRSIQKQKGKRFLSSILIGLAGISLTAQLNSYEHHRIKSGAQDAQTRLFADLFKAEDKIAEGYGNSAYGSKVPRTGASQQSSTEAAQLDSITNMLANQANTASTNAIEWSLRPHAMETSGYWALGTAHTYDSGEWSEDYENAVANTAPVPMSYDGAQKIEVNRTLTVNDVMEVQNSGFIDIPVLAGTVPVAASYGGKSVSITIRADNSYAISLSRAETDALVATREVKYTVAPTLSNNVPLHAIAWLDQPGNGQNGRTPLYDPAYDQMWNAAAAKSGQPLAPTKNVLKHAQEEAQYIRNNFTYSLSPLPTGVLFSMNQNAEPNDTFLAVMLQQKIANCAVAATLVALNNPALNEATGFLNAPGSATQNANILSSHESHAWLVDAAGNRIDATPTRGFSGTFFDEQALHSPKNSDTPLALGGLGVLLALGAFGGKKTATAATRVIRRGSANRMLKSMPVDQLDLALRTAQAGLYAPFGSDNAVTITPSEALVVDRSKVIARLQQPDLQGSLVRYKPARYKRSQDSLLEDSLKEVVKVSESDTAKVLKIVTASGRIAKKSRL
jgi:hypothetical protein